MFAEPDTENSFIKLYNKENRIYSVVEDLGSMIEQNIDKVKGYSVFKFKITKFSTNDYENINKYNVKVYNTDSPIVALSGLHAGNTLTPKLFSRISQ